MTYTMQPFLNREPRDLQILKLAQWGISYEEIGFIYGLSAVRISHIATAQGYSRPQKERPKRKKISNEKL